MDRQYYVHALRYIILGTLLPLVETLAAWQRVETRSLLWTYRFVWAGPRVYDIRALCWLETPT